MRNAELDIIPPVTLEQLIGKGQDLPSLPEIYLRVSEQLEDENSSVQQIGDTVQNDPAISTRVLKMVNSAYYGLPNQVSSIAQAVSLLGRERSGSTVSRPRSSRGNWRGIPLRSGSPRPCSPPDCCTTSASCC
jgi:hypothetical protein